MVNVIRNYHVDTEVICSNFSQFCFNYQAKSVQKILMKQKSMDADQN